MDPPPTAPPSSTAVNLNYPDSLDSNSSPRSRIVENWADDHLPHVPGAKLRLMCSYGGHIMPRPHDKTLCYVGGDTRIVVVDRHSSLKDLCNRLSRTLLHGRPFTLKYQLPNEDLDNLISVATDEDLENMIEEHDRLTAASPPRPSRLRLFLFFTKPESSVSMGSLLDDAKSETWFVDALNNSGILTRGVSDSATVECLVNLDGVPPPPPSSGVTASDSSNNLEAQAQAVVVESHDSNNKQVKNLGDVNSSSLPDSPMVEKNSSYGSSSSSPSMANLPPIRVRADENGGGSSRLQLEQRAVIEEQFAQMTFGGVGSTMKHDDGYPMTTMMLSAPINPMPPIPVPMENTMNRVISDDERSDQGAPVGLRKPPLPLQPVPRTSGGLSLPSPDSVASDSSIASANSFSRTVYYQDQAAYIDHNKAPVLSHSKSDISDPNSGFQREQQQQQVLQDSNLTTHASLLPQMDQNQQIQQQQYVQANTHYIHHHPAATGTVPISSYYQVYAAPSQQQIPHPMNHQQYPVYMMPVGHTQAYNMGGDPNVVGSVRPIIATATPSAAASYKDGTPPIYPTKPASSTIPEAAAQTLYKAPVAAAASSAAFHQIPSGQYHQQQYMGVPQIHHHHQQPQSIAVASSAANYGYDYGGNPHEQSQSLAYYTQQQQQQQIAPLPSQYQSMSPAVAAAALSDASKQFPAESIQQPNRTTQPV